MTHPAAGDVGTVVLLISNNTVVGEGTVRETSRNNNGDVVAVVTMTDENAKKLIAETLAMKALQVSDLIRPDFSYQSGEYISSGFGPAWESELNNIFKDIRIVSKTDLQYGMVPDTFKDVSGYGERCASISL